ncbi:MAG TPA: hypothetical protein VHI52_17750 [Verrucomicrobiae bacterium]|nr:hypothetical protein [Verrucomicrobiae bacterium]
MSLEDRLYPLLGLYERLPRVIKRGVGAAWRVLPERWRLGSAYQDFRAITDELPSWTAGQIQEYQFEQIRQVLAHAESVCPFYQQRFAQAGFKTSGFSDFGQLSQIPTLSKEELLKHREELVAVNAPKAERLYITTGGSTGVPVGFYLQKGISRPKEQAFLEAQWKRAGYFAGARLAVIRGHVTSDKAHGRITSYDATRDWLMLSSYHLTVERLPEYLEALEKFKPDLLHAYPSAALQLAEFLEDAGQVWRLPLRGLLCGSERLTLPPKRLLEKIFKCRVYRWYGHSERVVLAGEGRNSELFYFWPAYGFLELGPPDSSGLQEVIGTSFHNRVMPLIRYRTGDYVRLAQSDQDGPLEFPWPAASDVAGREQEFLISGNGRRISLTAFNMHDSLFNDIYAVQFYQETPGQAEFRYVAGPAFHRSRLPLIEQGIRRKLGDDFKLVLREVRETEKSPRGKHKWLVSKISPPQP